MYNIITYYPCILSLYHISSYDLIISRRLTFFSSLSVERTALDIYKGLKQGRDVVVPGIVNKMYTYLFSQILPSAAVGAITKVRVREKQSYTIDWLNDWLTD